MYPTLTVAKANRFGVFYGDCLIRYKNRQGPIIIIIPDARFKLKIQNPRYIIQDARCETIPGTRYNIPGTCNMYQIQYTWYVVHVYEVLYLASTGTGTSSL